MTPAPATGRTADENELRTEIIKALNAAFRGFSFPGGRWSTGFGSEMAADTLLSGPLAPILQEAATARKERDEARAKYDRMAYVWEQPTNDLHEAVEKGLRAEAAEQEAATLRARLQEAEKALKPFADVCDADHMRYVRDEQVLELSTRAEVPVSEKLRGRDFRAARRALLMPEGSDA